MSTESSELKFVRCPSCKSLVPSVASRCRMCGHQFDGSSKHDESESSSELPKEENVSAANPFSDAKVDKPEEQKAADDSEEVSRKKQNNKRKRKPSQNIEAKEFDTPSKEEKKEIKQEEKKEVQMNSAPKKSSSQQSAGELFAWLIHYGDNPKGAGIEIRNGQFFIGSERLREADIVIDNESISTPHILVKAGISEGIVVQDLMSEHGTLVKRAGESSYQEHKDPVEVSHGDWLRLGEYEVLVCIVPAR